MKVARPLTPSFSALTRESATMSALNSTPIAVAPRLAAVMTVRPSPEPRSITTSDGATLAMSSMRSTMVCAVGTQMTSLPGCPTRGSNLDFSSASATLSAAMTASAVIAGGMGRRDFETFMGSLQTTRARSARRAPAIAFDRVAVDAAGILLLPDVERDLGAVHLALGDRLAGQAARELLVFLLEHKVAIRSF